MSETAPSISSGGSTAPDVKPASLLEAASRQLTLPGVPTEADWQADEHKDSTKGNYTGERLFLRAPQVYQAIVEMLAAGVPVRTQCRLLHVTCETVQGVREREPVAIRTAKERLSERLMALGQLTAEILRDQLCRLVTSGEELSVRDIQAMAVTLGIVTDKGLLTGGQATSRVEIQVSRPGHEDFNALVQDITPQVESMGLGRETPGAKEGAPAAGSGPALLPPGSAPEAANGGCTDE